MILASRGRLSCTVGTVSFLPIEKATIRAVDQVPARAFYIGWRGHNPAGVMRNLSNDESG